MPRFVHLAGVLAVAALIIGLATVTNDFQKRVLFMVGVNYIAAAG